MLSSNEEVMKNACIVLQNIAANENNIIIIAKEGGISIVSNIMKMHASNEKVMGIACGALWSIAMNENNEIIIVKEGGIPVLLHIMKRHASNVNLMHICKTLSTLLNG